MCKSINDGGNDEVRNTEGSEEDFSGGETRKGWKDLQMTPDPMSKYVLAWMNVCRFQPPIQMLAPNICFYQYMMFMKRMLPYGVPLCHTYNKEDDLQCPEKQQCSWSQCEAALCIKFKKSNILSFTYVVFSFYSGRQTLTLWLWKASFPGPARCTKSWLCVVESDSNTYKAMFYYVCITSSRPAGGLLFYNLPRGDTPHPLHLC